MSPIKHYLEKSLLIPPETKKDLQEGERQASMEEDLLIFMKTYAPLEKEILDQVNRELELLNAQIKAHIREKENELQAQEIRHMEQELAYI